MRNSYFPTTDAKLIEWSRNISGKLGQDYAAYGITQQMAADLAAAFEVYSAAYTAAAEPSTRTRSRIVARNDTREKLKAQARRVVEMIQARPHVTDEQKVSLGLTVRKRTRTRVPPPTDAPGIEIRAVMGRTVRVQLRDVRTGRHAKPARVGGAVIFTFAGDEPPADLSKWSFALHTSRARVDITLPATVAPGAKVWFAAFWTNPRLQRGPLSAPVSTHVQFGVLKMAA